MLPGVDLLSLCLLSGLPVDFAILFGPGFIPITLMFTDDSDKLDLHFLKRIAIFAPINELFTPIAIVLQGYPTTTAPIAKGNVMPPYCGKAVTWTLIQYA